MKIIFFIILMFFATILALTFVNTQYGGNLLLRVGKGSSNLPHFQSVRTHLIDVI